LVVHPDGRSTEPTLSDWVLANYPQTKFVGDPIKMPNGTLLYRPGIVHRLDKETSGVMIIAKTQKSFDFFKQQFMEREVRKMYNAFVWGIIKEDKGKIERPIGRSKTDFRKWSAERHARGELREAITEYIVVSRKQADHISGKIPKNFTYLEVYPKTGRTHQIRVHFKAVNHPVVADSLYAENHPKELGFNRVALHARTIEIEAPDGQMHMFEAPLPEDFKKALASFS
jgi:23S rRNA pseudouridine1911/1915/1917 synthase